MANTKISQLTNPGTALGPDEFRIARFNGLDYDDYKLEIDDVVTYVDTQLTPISSSDIGAAGGIAPLDAGSLVPAINLPYTTISYQGTWDASTNIPVILSGAGIVGDFYWIMTAGSTTIDGISSWLVGDAIVFDGSVWQKGTMGAPGTPGPAGNTILSGAGNPTAGTGTNGDFYINTATNTIFGPKAAGTWPSGVLLVGPTGAAGAAGAAGATGSNGTNGTNGTNGVNGRTILSGGNAPSSGNGIDGDFYIDILTYQIYGPKLSGIWPTPPINLVGPTGASGSGSSGINSISAYGATGTGVAVFIKDAINPITGLAYGNTPAGLLAAETRWNLVKQRWTINAVNFSGLSAYPIGGTVTFATGSPGNTSITCTFTTPTAWNSANFYPIGSTISYTGGRYRCILGVQSVTTPNLDITHWTPYNITDAARELATKFCQGVNDSNALVLTANVVGSTVFIYRKVTTTLAVTLGNGTAGSFTNTVQSTYNASIINMATDTVDWVALQQAFYEVETTNGQGKKVLNLGYGAHYVLSRGLDLPNRTGTGNNSNKQFTINGNNSTLSSLNGVRRKLISRDIPSQDYANDGTLSNLDKIDINNLEFKLPYYQTKDTNPLTQAVGLIIQGYQCNIEDCTFAGGDIGLDIQFGLQTFVNKCKFIYQNVFGLAIRGGQWFGAGLSNAQSNGTIVDGCKFRLGDQDISGDPEAQFAGIYVAVSSDCSIRNIVFEGGSELNPAFQRCNYGLVFDSMDATVVKDFEIYNIHLEKSFEYYAMQFRTRGDSIIYVGKVTLIATQNFNRLIDFGVGPVFETPSSTVTYSGNPRITVERFPYKPQNGVIFRNNSAASVWRITDVMTDNSTEPVNGTQWISLPAATNIWDTAITPSKVYDGYYNSPTYNTIQPLNISGTIPIAARIVASSYFV